MTEIKVTTWNVNGIRAREAEVLDWLATEKPDVLCLQEIKASPENVPPGLLALPGYWTYWHGHKGYSGVALHLSRAAFADPPQFGHPAFDHETRIVTARAGELLFASIYVPNGGKDFPAKVRFLEELDRFAAEESAKKTALVLCGDYNVAREPRDVHEKLRNEKEIGQTPGERALVDKLVSEELVDLSRRFEPANDQLFTWWAPWRQHRQRNIGWRLDFVLASTPLAEAARSCRVSPEFGTSDHAPVTAVFEIDPARLRGGPPPAAAPPPKKPPPATGQLPLL